MSQPLVSVVMPVFNSAAYLQEAIDSMSRQTLRDFELIAIDDGSTDKSLDILQRCIDLRLTIVRNDQNLGIPRSLNRGLSLATGVYVARMDADDISMPERFARQVAYLDAHPEIGLLGARVKYLGQWAGLSDDRLLSAEACAAYLLFATPVAHPTVMMRRSVLSKHNLSYDESFQSAQDYELWTRFSQVSGITNLSERLLKYRMHSANITTRVRNPTAERVRGTMLRQLGRLGLDPSPDECQMHEVIANSERLNDVESLERALRWLEVLRKANDKAGLMDAAGMDEALAFVWFRLLANCGNLGFSRNRVDRQCSFRRAWRPSFRRRTSSELSMVYHAMRRTPPLDVSA